MSRTNPKRVNWTSDEDLQCAILGALGFSTKYIGEQTGLTNCQITYRLGKGSIKRKDYRNGESDMAQRVIQRAMPNRPADIRSTLNLKAK